MELIDEENHLAGGFAHLFHNAFHALFELAAVFGACHKAGKVKGNYTAVFKRLRNISAHDSLRETLGDSGLADAWFSDKYGVVLGAPAENLNNTLDFSVAADTRVKFALLSELGEVSAEFIERWCARASFGWGHCGFAFLESHNFAAASLEVNTQAGQHTSGNAFTFANEAQEQVFSAYVVVVKLSGLLVSKVYNSLGARGKLHFLAQATVAAGYLPFDFLANSDEANPKALQNSGCHGVAFTHETEEKVFGPDVVFAEPGSLFLGEEDYAACALSKPLPHRFSSCIFQNSG